MRRVLLLSMTVVAVCGVIPALAQMPREAPQSSGRTVPVGTAVIAGTVVDAATGHPIPGARVNVAGEVAIGTGRGAAAAPIRVGRTAVSDAQGGFEVRHLPGGRYTVNVSQRSFLNGGVGQRKPGGQGTAFSVSDDARTVVNVRLTRGGVITGMVLGESGAPVPNARVILYRYTSSNVGRQFSEVGGDATDDRGVYRLHSLQPGDYYVAVRDADHEFQEATPQEMALIDQAVSSGAIKRPTTPDVPATVTLPAAAPVDPGPFGRLSDALPTFYPSATSPAGAKTIRVVGGDEHSNVDISLRHVSASNVEGAITNPPGTEMHVQLQIASSDPAHVFLGGVHVTDGDQFFVNELTPGTYTIFALATPQRVVQTGRYAGFTYERFEDDSGASESLWGRTTVTVSGETRVRASLTLQPGRAVAGRVVFDTTSRPDLSQQTVTVRLVSLPESGISPPQLAARVDSEGQFVIRGVPPGRFVLSVTGANARSAILNGQDIMDTPLELDGHTNISDVVLTLIDRAGEVSGTFTPADGMTSADSAVLVVPTDERFWFAGSRRVAAVPLDSYARYRVRGLPAGHYFIAVVNDFEEGRQFDVGFLKTLLAAPGVYMTLGEGERMSRDLRASVR